MSTIFAPFKKTYQLKTKLKVADCAEHLTQFCDADNKTKNKPLTGWVGAQSFELAPNQAGLISVQSKGSISPAADGSIINVTTEASGSSKRALGLAACAILGALASLVHSVFYGSDDVGIIWSLFFTVLIPTLVWIISLFCIRQSLESKHKPFINLLCSSLNAHAIDHPTTLTQVVTTEKPSKSQIGRNLRGFHATPLLLVPIVLGACASVGLAHGLQNLAHQESRDRNHAATKLIYQPAVALSSILLAPDPAKQGECYERLAFCLNQEGKYTEAETLYRKAITLIEKPDKPSAPSLMVAYKNLAQNYEAQNKLVQAEEMYYKSLSLLKRNSQSETLMFSNYLHKLALLHTRQGQTEQAVDEEKEAVQIEENLKPAPHR